MLPFVGFGNIRLGMTRAMVCTQLGEPDRVEPDPYGNVSLVYVRAGLECTFRTAHGDRLSSVTFESPGFLVGNSEVVGIAVQRLVKLGEDGVLPGLYLEQDFPELESGNYACDSLGLAFWTCEVVVENMTLYPRYDDTGEHPIFPT